MRYRFILSFFAVASASVFVSGCQMQPPTSVGRFSVPTSGTVRVTVNPGETKGDRIHWNWTVIGERNWDEAASGGTDLRLQKSYPMNSDATRRGCFTWMVDLTVQRIQKPHPNPLLVKEREPKGSDLSSHWEAVLHGSNGDTVTAHGDAPLKTDEEPVIVLQKQDTNPRLPVTLTLAQVGGTPIILRIAE